MFAGTTLWLFQNFTLIIERVEPYDGAKYVCEITSPEIASNSFNITGYKSIAGECWRKCGHQMLGLGKSASKSYLGSTVHPTVSISPDTNPLLVNVGENVVIKCSASGNPPPKVTWARQDGQQLPARALSEDGQLRITRVAVDDTGVYECTATNNIGADAHDSIEVRVQCESLLICNSNQWLFRISAL
ncbi:unnamed protein product [Gongylonema pulchrum]|uniref:Ig-like domain-containing protein n=1 Tax=Gongylonema pulchrum TaxID=637853 RepID=A0A183E9M4_9BILA|nr:unnamed protein product [Gongylonema pulchrum]